jgi:hypothetical protein
MLPAVLLSGSMAPIKAWGPGVMTSFLSRRIFLDGLAASAVASSTAIAQGACRDGYGQGRCPLPVVQATAPIKEVFDPTGWTTLAWRASPSTWWITGKKPPSTKR